MSMLASSSPQLTPSVKIESPNSPPRGLFNRSVSRSPERGDAIQFGKVKGLISQHSSRTSSRPTTPSAESNINTAEQKTSNSAAPKPPPVNRADKPKIPAKPTTVAAAITNNGLDTLVPDANQRRPSFEARASPFNTPPSSDESPSPPPSTLSAAELSQSLKSVSRPAHDQPRSSQDLPRPIPAVVEQSVRSIDPRSMGFAKTPTAPERIDARTVGLSKPDPRPPSREAHVPARANTVSDRAVTRDPRDSGFGAPPQSQQRHVSENIRSSAPRPPSAAPSQATKLQPIKDARTFGFSKAAAVPEAVAEEPTPTLPPRHTIKAPPPRPSEESKKPTPRPARQPSPGVVPDRSTKPGAAPTHKPPAAQVDSRFLPPPKRNTDTSEKYSGNNPRATSMRGENNDSDEAEGYVEAPNTLKSDYPDATQTNRRPPSYQSSLPEVQIKSESRTFDVCGQYICTGGYTTKVFDMSTGEQVTGINHGETVKATAVSFKPGVDLKSEGQRIWIGNNIGDLQEVDMLTHSVMAQNSSHNRREILQILKHQRDLWTLDDDGKLFVWLADETGVPNLKYSHISHKVQRGHTFSLVAMDDLWLATGKEIRVYRPGNEASFAAITKPMSQSGSGDITSGDYSKGRGGRVYFGHTDGKVSIYSTTDYTIIGSVKASDYKINGLAMIGDDLWAGYKTGKIYVYDTTTTPWKVRKDWRAHDGPIQGLVLDGRSLWTMNRLQVTSVGHDGYARFWDGMLETDWIEHAMQERDIHYCTFREIRAAVVTWNVGAASPYDLRTDFVADACDTQDPPEILVFGFQEVVDLEDRAVTAKSILGFGKKKDPDSTEQHQSRVYREWRDYLSKMISRYTSARYAYSELQTSSLIGLFQCIFIRQEERPRLRDVHATNVKCGMKGHYGNKGALVTRFVIDDSSLCFINCHLAAGQTHTSHRNNDIATILESENLPIERDADARMSLFVGGGDGTQILDHEISILNGDLNYRIDAIPRDTVINLIKRNDMAKLLERDQLLVSRRRVSGFRLSAFNELPLTFAPTYKYDVGTDNYDSSDKKRAPAWCDRILYRGSGKIKQIEYRRHEVKVSDHRPVSAIFKMRVKRIDARKRAKVKEECYEQFGVVKQALAEKISQQYLVNELGVGKHEAKRLIVGT